MSISQAIKIYAYSEAIIGVIITIVIVNIIGNDSYEPNLIAMAMRKYFYRIKFNLWKILAELYS